MLNMKYKGTILVGTVIIVLIAVLLSSNTYRSSPGFVSSEGLERFLEQKPTCYGISILLNESATWSDAPGLSLCIGYLKR